MNTTKPFSGDIFNFAVDQFILWQMRSLLLLKRWHVCVVCQNARFLSCMGKQYNIKQRYPIVRPDSWLQVPFRAAEKVSVQKTEPKQLERKMLSCLCSLEVQLRQQFSFTPTMMRTKTILRSPTLFRSPARTFRSESCPTEHIVGSSFWCDTETCRIFQANRLECLKVDILPTKYSSTAKQKL